MNGIGNIGDRPRRDVLGLQPHHNAPNGFNGIAELRDRWNSRGCLFTPAPITAV